MLTEIVQQFGKQMKGKKFLVRYLDVEIGSGFVAITFWGMEKNLQLIFCSSGTCSVMDSDPAFFAAHSFLGVDLRQEPQFINLSILQRERQFHLIVISLF